MANHLDWIAVAENDLLKSMVEDGLSYILITTDGNTVEVRKWYNVEHKSDILKALKDERKMLGSDLDVKLDMRSLGPEDHAILEEFRRKVIEPCEEREERLAKVVESLRSIYDEPRLQEALDREVPFDDRLALVHTIQLDFMRRMRESRRAYL